MIASVMSAVKKKFDKNAFATNTDITIDNIKGSIKRRIGDMDKRERVLAVLKGEKPDRVPACFSLHFPEDRNSGEAGVKAHIDFFRDSGADVYKIMNENLVPVPYPGCTFPEAYKSVGPFSKDSGFIRTQIDFTKRILDASDGHGFTMGTLHGICASALHPIEKSGIPYEEARLLQLESLRRDRDTVKAAFDRVAEALILFVHGYAEAGVDSVFYAALGAEYRYFSDEEFCEFIKPYDLMIMDEIRKCGMYCFLHICKDRLDMSRYEGYGKHADAVNWGVYEAPFSLEAGRKLFSGCAVMGGLPNRSGVLADGSDEEIEKTVHSILDSFGTDNFILGADCTLSTDQDLSKVRAAVRALENYR